MVRVRVRRSALGEENDNNLPLAHSCSFAALLVDRDHLYVPLYTCSVLTPRASSRATRGGRRHALKVQAPCQHSGSLIFTSGKAHSSAHAVPEGAGREQFTRPSAGTGGRPAHAACAPPPQAQHCRSALKSCAPK